MFIKVKVMGVLSSYGTFFSHLICESTTDTVEESVTWGRKLILWRNILFLLAPTSFHFVNHNIVIIHNSLFILN